MAVAVGAVAWLARGPDDAPLLDALRADPIARYEPPRGRLVRARADPEGESLGKPHPAWVQRWFALTDGGDTRGQLERVAAAARAAGWALDTPVGEGAVTGRKQLAGGVASLVLALRDNAADLPSGVAPPALEVSLRR